MSFNKTEPPSYDEYNGGQQALPERPATSEPAQIDTEICDFPEHPKQNFTEVFMDPVGYRDNAVGKVLSPINQMIFGAIFDYTQSTLYYVLSIILGIFMGLAWGIIFAVNNYFIVWAVQPTVKILFTWMRITAILVRAVIRSMLDPFFESLGLSLSFIRANFHLNLSGLKGIFTSGKRQSLAQDIDALQPV